MKKHWYFLSVVAIISAALGLRLYKFAPPLSIDTYNADPIVQLPPGLHSDEAFNGLAGLRILRTGELIPYSDIDQGRSVVHMTITAAVIAVFGPIAESPRITSLLAGMLSIVGIIWLARTLFQSNRTTEHVAVLEVIAAAQVATTYWFINFSRVGFEQITLPMLMLPTFATLWQWLHRPSLGMTVVAGMLLGLTLYTYFAAYAVPLTIMLAVAVYTLAERTNRPPLRNLITYAAAFSITALPLIVYAVNYPDQFIHRLQDTAAETTTNLADSAINTLGGLIVRGDTTTAYNLPGRPLLDPVQTVLAVIGLAVCLRRSRQPEFLFVPIWTFVMLLPAALSNGAPSFNRIAGAVPAIIMLVAIGGGQVYRLLITARWSWLGPIVLIGTLTFTFISTANDYFNVWPNSNGLLYSFSLPERIQAQVIANLPATADVYLTPSDSGRSMFAYLWQDRALARSFNGRRCSVTPRQTMQDTLWLLNSQEDKYTRERLTALYPQLKVRPLWVSGGTSIVRQISIDAGLQAQVPTHTLATIGDLFRLRDYQLITPPERGSRLRARLLWEPARQTSDDWTIATYLIDAAGQIRVQDDNQPCDGSYPTSRWQTNELISDDRILTLPKNLPAGEYRLAIVFYRLSDNTRLPVRDPDGRPLGDMLSLDSVVVS